MFSKESIAGMHSKHYWQSAIMLVSEDPRVMNVNFVHTVLNVF
jgi:hypothetical protein